MFRILIVDDEQIILNGIRFMIERKINLGFDVEVVTADYVEKAIDILETQPVDLLLTDIRMPGMNGFDLISYVQEKEMDIRVVILTSHADFNYAQQAIRLNVQDFILKPVNGMVLKAAVKKVWREKKEQSRMLHQAVLKKVRDVMLYNLPSWELDNDAEVFGRLFPYTYFTVIAVSCICPEESYSQWLRERLLNHYNVCYCFLWKERSQIIAICNHSQKQHQIQTDLLKKELRMQYRGEQIEIAASITSDSYQMLHYLYSNAVQKIFCIRNFGKNESLSGLSLITYQDCVSVFLENDVVKMRQHLKEYLDKVRILSGLYGVPKEIFASFLYNIMLYLENNGISVPDEWIDNMSLVTAFEQLMPAMEAKIIELRKSLESNFGNQEEWLIKKLLDYIREHYNEDISLEKLANDVGYNTSYISNVFKMKIGQSYLGCIHGERLRAAKKLLVETDYTMEYIADIVGYNSASQFARVFRKYEKVSPSEFRKRKM